MINQVEFIPQIIINEYSKKDKVLIHLEKEFKNCEEFFFSVAFINETGLICLLDVLKQLEEKGIKGTIITSQYQNFTTPQALRKLKTFKNITLKIVIESTAKMHTKGYIFKHKENYSVIIGSSNITQSALCSNVEWNLKIDSSKDKKFISDILDEFKRVESIAIDVSDEFILEYEKIYNEYFKNQIINQTFNYLKPNKMQIEALSNLKKIREEGGNKALLISATGTGKTYLSAFDIKEVNPKRFLFIVHRETIAKNALESFRYVLKNDKTLGLLTGNSKNTQADYIFSTIQTISKNTIYNQFREDEFDYIVIDEVHKAGAYTYQKIFNHFKPKFLLGMSATPERNDSFDIFKLFDYTICYEIRLEKAMEEDLIVPFHYFGISEVFVESKLDLIDFNYLVAEERVKNITKAIDFYGYSGDRVRGLIFCSRKDEGKQLSNIFNKQGYRTIFLDGTSSQEEREEAINRLETKDYESGLDYIFTVDIFNEGVDIPSVNQVILLRPTKSSIIFTQQLGRGLRKYHNKEYLIVIDFIGNYESNFLIPIALSGNTSYNKDSIRKYLFEANKVIPGCSTISFDSISKERIFKSLDNVSFNTVKLIKDNYLLLKQKCGRIPNLIDFEMFNSIDVLKVFTKFSSYHDFLEKHEKEYKIKFNEIEKLYLEYISKKLANGKKPHELELLNLLINNQEDIKNKYLNLMESKYNKVIDEVSLQCSLNILSGNYEVGVDSLKYKNLAFIQDNKSIIITNTFLNSLKNNNFKNTIIELIEFGLNRNKTKYFNFYKNTFLNLYQKYSYEDVFRLLNWQKKEVELNVGGYKYDSYTNTFPIFINYHKSEDLKDSFKYEDRFTTPKNLIWYTKQNRTLKSKDVLTLLNYKETNLNIYLFVRKNKDDFESKEFYFLGKVLNVISACDVKMKITNALIVEIEFELETSVSNDLYEYLLS